MKYCFPEQDSYGSREKKQFKDSYAPFAQPRTLPHFWFSPILGIITAIQIR